MLTAYMEHFHYREAFKGTVEAVYRQAEGSSETVEALDKATAMAENIVNEVEDRLHTAQPASASTASARIIEGELVDHGAARYQHNDG
jgi:type IV secretion system protein VirB4